MAVLLHNTEVFLLTLHVIIQKVTPKHREMDLSYFIYLIIYVSSMVLIFVLSGIMLHPRTRVIFKVPVPHLHDSIAKLLIPFGFTYIMFLPDFYLEVNAIEWREHYYVVCSMITAAMCLSFCFGGYIGCLQQGVRQLVLQPAILLLPLAVTLWYMIEPQPWMLMAFSYICMIEFTVLLLYYIKLYSAFVRDVKNNYSSISDQMIMCLWLHWGAGLASVLAFLMATLFDTLFMNLLNILANMFTILVLVYSTEHLVPLPENVAEDADVSDAPEVSHGRVAADEKAEMDIAKALRERCEAVLLFCNPDLSLQDLSLAVGTNRTYLSKWFMENDTTFYNYINGLRIEHAGKLLLSTDSSVTQIQGDSGFTSKTTFRKYFLERYGCSPTEYRKGKVKE